jgi:hemolysin activation/secretion protein
LRTRTSFALFREGAAIGAILLGFVASHALADGPPSPPSSTAIQPGHERPLPEEAPPPPQFDFSIEAPQRAAVPRSVDEIHFQLKDIRVEGAETLPADSFRPLYGGLIGHDVTLSDILKVADDIEGEYKKAGYLLVRAYVPPQHVKDGIFTIKVVEGYVAGMAVSGAGPDERDQVKAYLAPLLHEKPLRLATIERALLLANDIPGMTATGVLRPAQVPGASELVVTLQQPAITGGIAVDNRGSKFSGIWTTTGTATINSLFGNDALTATLAASPHSLEQIAGQVKYDRLIGDSGLLGSLLVAVSKGSPGSTLGTLDVRTDSWAVGPRLTYPLLRGRSDTLLLEGGFTVQDAKVDILGAGISHDKWRVVDVGLSWSGADLFGDNYGAVVDLAQGLHILGATPNDSPDISQGGKTDFTKLTASWHETVPLFDPVSLAFAANGQYSFQPLITGEQILFGGNQIGRGYDPGAITGDRGIGASIELRYDTHAPQIYADNLQPYAFFDTAHTEFIKRPAVVGPALGDFRIRSAGAGLRFWFPYNIYTDVELAHTFDAVPGSDNGKTATKVLMDVAVTF